MWFFDKPNREHHDSTHDPRKFRSFRRLRVNVVNRDQNRTDLHWLAVFLDEAIRENLCTSINCTTCGSWDFRNGLLEAFATSSGKTNLEYLNIETAQSLAEILAAFNPPQESRYKYEPAIRFILYDLWQVLMGTVKGYLGESFAGHVYEKMDVHYRIRLDEQRHHAEMNDPLKAQERREEKKRLSQEKHQERLEKKKERDRIWREKQNRK